MVTLTPNRGTLTEMHTNVLLTFLCIYSMLINALTQEINGQKIYKNKVHYE